MTKILDWRRSDDPRDLVHLAVQAIAEGHVVAVPTETCYLLVASALQASAVDQLTKIASAAKGRKLSIIVRSSEESLDLVPHIGQAARRLIRKAWPGPLIVQLQDSNQFSSLRCLDPEVISAVSVEERKVRLWQPSHEVIHYITRLASGPLVGVIAPNRLSPSTTATDIVDVVQDHYVLAIDAGGAEFPGEPTVVEIDGSQGCIVEHGVVDSARLQELSQMVILFVCTGNTCRSPMAQALMQRKINERFGYTNKLDAIPIIAISAGVSAMGGDPASHGALQAIRNFQASLDHHASTQLNSDLVDQADLILAMGQRHRSVIVSQWPSTAIKVSMLDPDGGEIVDPFGGPLEAYQKCAQQLDRHTSHWVEHLDTSSLIQWV